MARIRSIKPEFASDGKIRRLSDTTALFFVLLWNHCDDYGYFELDTWELALKTARWRSQDILAMLSALSRRGLVRLSRTSGVGLVQTWSHQKIDRPRPSKWKDVEIRWDDAEPDVESSSIIRRKDRIGEDRKGKERIYTSLPEKPGTEAGENPFKSFIASYAEEYKKRYGSNPTITGPEASAAKRIVKAVGLARGLTLLPTYLTMNDSWFLTKRHDLTTFAGNMNAVVQKAETGLAFTQSEIRQADRAQATANAFAGVETYEEPRGDT